MISWIYAIQKKDDMGDGEVIYVGKTTNISDRKRTHFGGSLSELKRYKDRPLYSRIREDGGFDNFIFTILETCFSDRLDLAEKEWIDKLKPSCNVLIPSGLGYGRCPCGKSSDRCRNCNPDGWERRRRGLKSIYQRDRVVLIAKAKAYAEANKDKIAERGAAYREANKDKIAEKVAAYREANPNKTAEISAKYYQANKDKINAKKREARAAKKANA